MEPLCSWSGNEGRAELLAHCGTGTSPGVGSSLCSCCKDSDQEAESQILCVLRQGWRFSLLFCKLGTLDWARIYIWEGLEAATYLVNIYLDTT